MQEGLWLHLSGRPLIVCDNNKDDRAPFGVGGGGKRERVGEGGGSMFTDDCSLPASRLDCHA